MSRPLVRALVGALLLTVAADAAAFTHIVQPGDTLASVAERFYGRIQHERLLVAANALDATGGSPIIPGMRLEIPAVSHRRVRKGDSWSELARELLGSPHRGTALALANGTSAWIPPEEGTVIVVPYNLRVFVDSGDTLTTIARQYLGDVKHVSQLDHYNSLDGRPLARGDVVLVPVTDLALTQEGRAALEATAAARCTEGTGETRETQLRVQTELPALIADVRGGRYVDAVRRGNRFLASGALGERTVGIVHRQLLEAYVALEATGLATAACAEWRRHDRAAKLDPVYLSPKIIAACERAAGEAPP